MTTMLLFLGGCQREEEFVNNKNVIKRTDQSRSNSTEIFPSNHFLAKRPNFCNSTETTIDTTWNPTRVLLALKIYNEIKCNSIINTKTYGEPVWAATQYFKKKGKKFTVTPFQNRNGDKNSIFTVMDNGSLIGFHFLENFTDNNIQQESIWKWFLDLFDPIKCPTFGDGIGKDFGDFFSNLWDGFISIFSSGNSAGGYSSSGWGTFSSGSSSGTNNGGYYNYGSGGGVSSTGGAFSFINYTGGFWTCDESIKTEDGCKQLFKSMFNHSIDVPDLQEKIEKCGCYRAVFHASNNWNEKSDNETCLDCYGPNGPLSDVAGANHYGILERFIEYLRFPCNQVDQNQIDKILADIYDQACKGLTGRSGFYPGKVMSETLNELEKLGIPYISTSNTTSNKTLNGASISIAAMASYFGIKQSEIVNITDEELCKKLELFDCLFISEEDISDISNEGKKEVLDFYQNSTLLNVCTGDYINKLDKDKLFLSLCNSNNVTISGLNDAMTVSKYATITQYNQLLSIYNKNNISTSQIQDFLCNDDNSIMDLADEIGASICKSSFDNYTSTGNGFTIEMECNKVITLIF